VALDKQGVANSWRALLLRDMDRYAVKSKPIGVNQMALRANEAALPIFIKPEFFMALIPSKPWEKNG